MSKKLNGLSLNKDLEIKGLVDHSIKYPVYLLSNEHLHLTNEFKELIDRKIIRISKNKRNKLIVICDSVINYFKKLHTITIGQIMNITKNISIAAAAFCISTISMDIVQVNNEISFKLQLNKAYADDDIEVITLSGGRYTPPAYYLRLSAFQLANIDYYDGGESERAAFYEDWKDHCE